MFQYSSSICLESIRYQLIRQHATGTGRRGGNDHPIKSNITKGSSVIDSCRFSESEICDVRLAYFNLCLVGGVEMYIILL